MNTVVSVTTSIYIWVLIAFVGVDLFFKMAASQGYQCAFIDSVSDDFYCKKCKLVARRLTLVTCCSESFCQVCIEDTRAEGKPCPECGGSDFNIYEHQKNKKRINCLQVYCSMKERGCSWTGPLEQLDTHLDPDQDNCQYVDTKCPLNCNMAIPKNRVEQHVAKECVKRDFTCQHCNFKATYEEVVGTHLAECKYVPLQCPNFCGVTFEREIMEDHMKICRLQEVGCEFSGVGCDDRFSREDQEEHIRQNSQKHLTLITSLSVETKEEIRQMLEQDKKHNEEEEKLRQKLEEQKKISREQEKKLGGQEKKLMEQEKMLREQERKLVELEIKLGEQEKKLGEKEQLLEQRMDVTMKMLEQQLKEVLDKSKVNEMLFSNITRNQMFEMNNFSKEKAKDKCGVWRSPAMYTHPHGYKFHIGVNANGSGAGRGNMMCVCLYFIPGEYDRELKWPARAKFTLELINQKGGENATCTTETNWNRPLVLIIRALIRTSEGFLEHSKLNNFLKNDTLYFYVSEVKLL